ncbi:hypothetical protein DL96DRAFT_1714711 [Flagelloscypha sp. PMI_526]|nr:hypothetical protein DL96DRAFT_1714711 [Flagelloscypha sp. PMI_526]
MSLEPRFPPELEFRIFNTCASADSQTISVLLLVCRRVKGWIEPLRFRAIIFKFSIETFRRFDGFYSLAMAKPLDFLAQTVLFCAVDRIRHRDRAEKAVEILRRCSGILDLALWTEFQGDLLPFDLCSFKNLRHLSLNWRTVQPVINFLSHAKGDSASLLSRTSFGKWIGLPTCHRCWTNFPV